MAELGDDELSADCSWKNNQTFINDIHELDLFNAYQIIFHCLCFVGFWYIISLLEIA